MHICFRIRSAEIVVIGIRLNSCSLTRCQTTCLRWMNIHIAVKLHVSRNCFTHFVFFQLKVFILEYFISACIRHYVRNLRVIRSIALIKAAIYFNIAVVVISSLVIANIGNFPATVNDIYILIQQQIIYWFDFLHEMPAMGEGRTKHQKEQTTQSMHQPSQFA